MPEARKVYSRLEKSTGEDDRSARKGATARAPALVPLITGFLLLLALVLTLGLLSGRELNSVSDEVLDLQRRRGNQLRLLLDLRIVLTELNNEARARAETEARGGIIPPFALRRRNAVTRTKEMRELFATAPRAATEEGRSFLRDIENFVAISESSGRYTLEGFESFRNLSQQLDSFIDEANREQGNVLLQTEELQNRADARIRSLMLLTLLAGAVVASGTIWEVRRRFRQLQTSLDEVRREREFSTQVLEGMPTAVAAFDAGAHLRSANEYFLRIFPRAVIGAPLSNESGSPDTIRMLQSVTAERANAAAYRGRWQFRADDTNADQASTNEASTNEANTDGAEAGGDEGRTFDAYVAPIKLDEEQGLILTLVDVTEATAAERALQRQASLAAVGQAAAQVAHEIKNPLGSIRLGVALLRDTAQDEESRTTINLIERGIAHLNKLTIDVTQFSRERPLELTSVDVNELLDSSLELVRDKVAEKRIRIDRRYMEEHLRGDVDADQLRQVFVNLLANAIDASAEDSTLHITAEAHRRDPTAQGHVNDGRTQLARISIADEGSGIDESTRKHLFEPFFTTKKRGTGLGLVVSKKIVEQHGGKIEAESQPGAGTRFTIQLPI